MIIKFFTGLFELIVTFKNTIMLIILVSVAMGILIGAAYTLQLDNEIRSQFEGKRWSLPARVFARPLELHQDKAISLKDLETELKLLNYRKVDEVTQRGQYNIKGNTVSVFSRGFQFADDVETSQHLNISVQNNNITALNTQGKATAIARLDPVLIGNFYPSHNEDRILVKLNQLSPLLIKTLIAVEDKNFHSHLGVNPRSIGRALLANIKAGRTVEGASTITQQLVKNYFLSNERTYSRKLKEAVMAILLEIHYSKDEILEAYLNEINLGQNKQRAVHGFGLASQFYFSRPINELDEAQIALLIAIVKGPTAYNPRRQPEAAKIRRNLILSIMHDAKLIDADKLAQLKQQPLGVINPAPPSVSPFPSYLQIVRQQLRRTYNEDDLRSEGLIVFTSMDPIIQLKAEATMRRRLAILELQQNIDEGKLEGAMIVSRKQGAEIIAVVSDRNPRFAGFNRAIAAKRQIGSLVKPAVYLAALEADKGYTLSSRVSVDPITVQVNSKRQWKPKNYSKGMHGNVLFEQSLKKSYNTSTVRIGLDVGLTSIREMLKSLGIEREIPPHPSMLLGAIELTPIEVQQMYHSLAAEGIYTPLTTIRSVMNSYGDTLKRYPLKIKRVASEENMYILRYVMQEITKAGGTAAYLSYAVKPEKKLAGKTGTTNNDVDSWFSGFSKDHIATVWVGRDDNISTGLTGASGALRVWADLFNILDTNDINDNVPENIKYMYIDAETGQQFNGQCGRALYMPFIDGTQPEKKRKCRRPVIRNTPVPNPTAPATSTPNAQQVQPSAAQKNPNASPPANAGQRPVWENLYQ